MHYAAHVPSAPLSRFVERMWTLRDEPAHATERVVPTGTLELVINLHADAIRIHDREGRAHTRSGAIVSGAYRRYFTIETCAHASIIGVHFHAGAAGAVLGLPAGELADAHVDLDALWGRCAAELRERLCEAPTAAARFAVLEHALRARLAGARMPHDAVPPALARLARPGVSVGEVAAELALSRRRLIEVVTADVGMTPKRLARVFRFQRAVALARRSTQPAWSALAITAGYFDQAHLINEFRELTGMTPRAFLAASSRVKVDHAVAGSNSSKP